MTALDTILDWYQTLPKRARESLSLANLHDLSKRLPTTPDAAHQADIDLKEGASGASLPAGSQATAAVCHAELTGDLRDRFAWQAMLYMLDSSGDWPADKVTACLDAIKSAHSGDCTKMPWTCLRCCAEDAYAQADGFLALFPAATALPPTSAETSLARAAGERLLVDDLLEALKLARVIVADAGHEDDGFVTSELLRIDTAIARARRTVGAGED